MSSKVRAKMMYMPNIISSNKSFKASTSHEYYLRSALSNVLVAYCIGFRIMSSFWANNAPIAVADASDITMNGASNYLKETTGEVVKDVFRV